MRKKESAGASERTRPGRHIRLAATFVLVGGILACVSQWTPPEQVGYHRTEPVRGSGAEVGALQCYACHDSFEDHYVASEAHDSCESCHGPGELHAYTARASDIRYPDSQSCASCHEIGSKTLLGWSRSKHARSGIICSDCHDTHNREPWNLRTATEMQASMLRRAGAKTQLCVSCHTEVAAQFDLPSHHPMREGMVGCTDCHSAHGSRAESLGAATQTCLECHQEVAGPWIYEHPPVSESCGYCHAPHGASADFLLETSQPAACISCHTLPTSGAVHDPYALTTRCTDCHNAVHGSFTDPHLRR